MNGLSLAQKFGLWKWLADTLLADLRSKHLIPQAEEEMPPGARLPVMFGGKTAGWVTRPKASQPAATVTDQVKLLAWAKVNYPAKVEYPAEVVVDAALIEFLQEHRPQSLRTGERVDRQWAEDICSALTKHGSYTTYEGEKLTDVPGITVPEAKPSVPTVKLEGNATEIIEQAWPQIRDNLGEVLALPAGESPQEAPRAA